MNLLALTICTVDYYPQLDKSYMGGNSLNVAVQWTKIACNKNNISIISRLGKDKNGETIFNFIKSLNINTSLVYIMNGVTAHNQLYVDEHGERSGIEGTWVGGVYENFLLSENDWEFVTKHELIAIPANNPNYTEMLKRKQNHQFISVDYLDIENKMDMESSVHLTDIAFITAKPNRLEYYKTLASTKNKLIVVTLGANGSYAFYNNESYFQPAIKIPAVIDTTGCGDAYQAAFAYFYYKTRDIKLAMFKGANAASKIAMAYGGTGK